MNTILSLASVMAPAAAVALLAGGVCPPQACHSPASGAGAPTASVALHSGATLASGILRVIAPGDLAAQPEARIRTHTRVVQQDDSGTYELVIDNGVPAAKVNGEAVPASRINEIEPGVWVIESEDGEVIARFFVGAPPIPPVPLAAGTAPNLARDFAHLPQLDRQIERQLQDLAIRPALPDRPGAAARAPAAPPPTMFGVVMRPAPEGTDGVLLERVIEGLPAARAGVRSGDVIVQIGSDPNAPIATPDTLRAVLRDKQPGDELKLRVLRDGDEKDITVTLDAFDSARLTQSGSPAQAMPSMRGNSAFSGAFAESLADGPPANLSREARQQMSEALEALRQAEQLASGEARQAHEHARAAIEQFVGALERMEADGLSTQDAMRGDLGRWFGQFRNDQMVWGDKPGMVFTLPRNSLQTDRSGQNQNAARNDPHSETEAARSRTQGDTEARLNAMAERLERIEKLLEKLAADAAQP
jgi:hypothetical protein